VALGEVAASARGRASAGPASPATTGAGAVSSPITKKSRANTLQLIERLQWLHRRAESALAARACNCACSTTRPCHPRRDRHHGVERPVRACSLVLAICWLFLGSRLGAGRPRHSVLALPAPSPSLDRLGYTLNLSVLLGVVIALGMLVDDAVVIVEAIYYRMQRGEQAHASRLGAVREGLAPVLASVLTTMAAFLPLMLLPGIVGKFMFVIPFVVTLGLADQPDRGLLDAAGAHPALAPKPAIGPRSTPGATASTRLRLKRYSRRLLAVHAPAEALRGAAVR
jgi:multidrug efflux pump subunit AcrB